MILSADIGTTSTKIGVFDNNLNIKAKSKNFEYSLNHPNELFSEIDPLIWWNSFIKAIKNINFPLKQISVITLSVNSPGFSTMDSNGEPIFPSIVHLDRRSYKQCKKIIKLIGRDKLLEITGNIPNPGASSAANILWIKENYPDIYKKSYMFGHTNTFFSKKLTGKWGIDPSNACLSNLFETNTSLKWNIDLCDEFKISVDKLPEIKNSDDIVGYLNNSMMIEMGLRKGIPVLMGGNDATCATLSVDLINEGMILNLSGTTEIVDVCTDKPILSDKHNIKNHVLKNKWICLFALNAGGKAIDWAKEVFYNDTTEYDFYKIELPKILATKKSSFPKFIPYLSGDRYSLKDKSAAFKNIRINSSKEDFIYSVCDGISNEVSKYIKFMETKLTLDKHIFISGGAANLLQNIKKDYLSNYTFKLVNSGSMVGAAKLAIQYL